MHPFPDYLPLRTLIHMSDDEIRSYEQAMARDVRQWREGRSLFLAEREKEVEASAEKLLLQFPNISRETMQTLVRSQLVNPWGSEPAVLYGDYHPNGMSGTARYAGDPISMVGIQEQPSIVPFVRNQRNAAVKRLRDLVEYHRRKAEELQGELDLYVAGRE